MTTDMQGYQPSWVPLREGLALALRSTGQEPDKVKPVFRLALQVGDIRAEGQVLQTGRHGWPEWTGRSPIPREFFEDNKLVESSNWVRAVLRARDVFPELVDVVRLVGDSPSEETGSGQDLDLLDARALSDEAKAALRILGRPDFEMNRTGEPGDPLYQIRVARDIVVCRADVERVFEVASSAVQVVDSCPSEAAGAPGSWKKHAEAFLRQLASSNEPVPTVSARLAARIEEALRTEGIRPPARKTIENWVSKKKRLRAVQSERKRVAGGKAKKG